MGIERQSLRDELVAVIAAGRELTPQHDYVLADVFLDSLRLRQSAPQRRSALSDRLRQLAAPLAAAILALAGLIFGLLASHGGHAPAAANPTFVAPRGFDPDGDRPWRREPGRSPSVIFPILPPGR